MYILWHCKQTVCFSTQFLFFKYWSLEKCCTDFIKFYTKYLCSTRLSYAIYRKATHAIIEILRNYLQQPAKDTEISNLYECVRQCYFVRQRTFYKLRQEMPIPKE